MKNLVWLFVSFAFCLFFFIGFHAGLDYQVRVNPSLSVPVASDQKCTCVPCLPDHFCKKCGHKSRDCPKLRWYFHPTNAVNRAAFPTNQPPLDLAN